MNNILHAVSISLIPFFIVLIAVSSSFVRFSKSVASGIQAVAAGFIIGSLMVDLMPRVMQGGYHFSYIISFVIGFVFMLSLQKGGGECCGSAKLDKPLRPFLTPFAIEFFVTGILIGIAAVTSTVLVILIALSFSLCNLICSLSIAARFSQSALSSIKRYGYALGLALLLPIGAAISSSFTHSIPLQWLNDLLSFAIACLLSLVLVELYPEAISVHKLRGVTIVFCAITFVFLMYYLL